MGITLTNFVDATPRDGSVVNDNLETVREWLNGNIVAGDVKTGAVGAPHILRPEHFPAPLKASLQVGADVYGDSTGMDKRDRAMAVQNITGREYAMVPNLARTVYVERASTVSVMLRYYAWAAWAVGVSTTDPNYIPDVQGVAAFTRLFINGSGVEHTMRRVMAEDWGQWSSVTPFKQEYSIHHMFDALADTYYSINLGVRVLPPTNTGAADPLNDAGNVTFSSAAGPPAVENHIKRVDFEARAFVVEIDAFAS
ncbi:MAG: hypothetical protein ABIL09_13815 [Gemmatimonadota bacterium]